MSQIGEFIRTAEGYSGRLHTLTHDVELRLVPADPGEVDNAPDFRVLLGAEGPGPDVGAGWKRTGERAGAYVAVVLDDPAFPQPIRANLFHSGRDAGACPLVWARPNRRQKTE